jgi:hypothetical protein
MSWPHSHLLFEGRGLNASFQRLSERRPVRCAGCSLCERLGLFRDWPGSRAGFFDPQGAQVARAPVKVVNAGGTSVAFALCFARLEICYDFRVLGKNR